MKEGGTKRRVKDNAYEEFQTLRFWFRQKYNLPPTDDRFLDMSDADIAVEFWAHRYYGFVLEKGAFPGPGEFDTEEIDAEITRWALEDGEALDHYDALQADDWEEVDLPGNGF